MKRARQPMPRPTRAGRALSRLVAPGRGLSRRAATGQALAESLRYTGRGASVSCSGVNGSPVTRRRLAVRKRGRENEDRSAKRTRIRTLNDAFRKTFWGGRVMVTAGEHDFVSVEHVGQTFFAKIDLYEVSLSSALPLPSPFLFLAARRKASISDRSAVAMRFSASTCIQPCPRICKSTSATPRTSFSYRP